MMQEIHSHGSWTQIVLFCITKKYIDLRLYMKEMIPVSSIVDVVKLVFIVIVFWMHISFHICNNLDSMVLLDQVSFHWIGTSLQYSYRDGALRPTLSMYLKESVTSYFKMMLALFQAYRLMVLQLAVARGWIGERCVIHCQEQCLDIKIYLDKDFV